jgi:hypothetical protein
MSINMMLNTLGRRFVQAVVLFCAWSVAPQAASQAADPQPTDAVTAILHAFDRYDIVGMSAAHGNEQQDDLILSLVRHPAFPRKAQIIVVECGNSKYQPVLDRYLAGEDVPIEEARQTWRNTSVLMCALSGFYDGFFPAIRALNQRLPAADRLRVFVGEPPTEWTSTGQSNAARDRNPMLTSLLTTEVLEKHRKALVLCGVGHLFHKERGGTAVTAYEDKYPGRTFVIDAHTGFAAFFDLERGHQLEARMRAWPTPSLVLVKGSWLADLDLQYFLWPFPKRMAGEAYADLVDAYLYLGPGASMTYEPVPDSIVSDQAYVDELSKRFGPIDVDGLRRRNLDRTRFTAPDRAEARQFAPGAECVGTFAAAERRDVPVIEIDFKNGVLSARWADATTWTALAAADGPMRYRLAAADGGSVTLECQRVADAVDRLVVESGGATPSRTLTRVP